MSDNESITASTDTQESSTTKTTTGSEGDSDQGYVATANCFAYANEPLARPGQVVESNPDADGILPLTLEKRSDGIIPVNQWCSCQCCHNELLVGVLEFRCCKEMTPALRIMIFDGSIKHIHCITQHEDFGPMTHATVLEQVGPLLKDRNGRSYRRRGSKTRNEDMSNNKLEKLQKNLFADGNRLENLILRKNRMKNIDPDSMKNLKNLKKLDISEMPSLYIQDWKFLLKMKRLTELKASVFSQCCFVNKEVPDVTCIAPQDYFSGCDEMIKSKTLRYIVWLVVIVIFGGNLISFILRIAYKDKNFVQNMLILNLNISDFLMGFYIVAMVYKDLEWGGVYYLRDHEWRSSGACKSFGVIAMVSSEVCVLTLAVITCDRRGKLVHGLAYDPMKRRTLMSIIALIWLISIIIAVVPAVVKSYFFDEEKAEGFYGANALCLPLQLPGEMDPAWEYCLAIFGVFNFLVASYMAWAYSTIFYTAYTSARDSGNQQWKKDESKLAFRFIAIVFTDILCWFPIAILIFISLAGFVSDTENHLYSWFSICVVPVNSAINPLIYTITNTFFWPKFKGWFKKIASVCRNCGQCCNNEESQAVPVQPNPHRAISGAIEMTGGTGQAHDIQVVALAEPSSNVLPTETEANEQDEVQPSTTGAHVNKMDKNEKTDTSSSQKGKEHPSLIAQILEEKCSADESVHASQGRDGRQEEDDKQQEMIEMKRSGKKIAADQNASISEKVKKLPSLIPRILQAKSPRDESVHASKGRYERKDNEEKGKRLEMTEMKKPVDLDGIRESYV